MGPTSVPGCTESPMSVVGLGRFGNPALPRHRDQKELYRFNIIRAAGNCSLRGTSPEAGLPGSLERQLFLAQHDIPRTLTGSCLVLMESLTGKFQESLLQTH